MKKNLVILHGWNSRVSRWQPLCQKLKSNFNIYLPVLPGFGQEPLSPPFSLNDYCRWLKRYLEQHRITKPIIVGHSFGGRIAILFSAKNNNLEKLVLIASAGIATSHQAKKTIGWLLAKTGKVFFNLPLLSWFKKPGRWFLYTLLREKDYYSASPWQRETMKQVLKKDLSNDLKKIRVPTLILWGERDEQTPIKAAYKMQRLIPDSRLKVWKDSGHNLPFTQTNRIAKAIGDFSISKTSDD